MGWRKFNESLDKAIPQKGDSAGDIIGKAVTSWIAAPMALLDLFDNEPSSPNGGSSREEHRGGGCYCNCPDHRD